MYRNMMLENVDRVERGEQPKGLLFDAERNRVSIPVIREDNALQAMRPEDGGPRIRNVNTQMISAGI
jgi:hypothetical protein